MQHETQVALAKVLFDHLDSGTTTLAAEIARNPVRVYTGAAQLEREWSMIRGSPQFFALSCRLPESGSYLADSETGVPVLLVRGEDGRVRAFLNVCRHRGAPVATGCGRAERNFVCPYHGWTYDKEGRLVGVPDRASFDGIETGEHGLVELPAVEHGGLIWGALAPGPPLDIERSLGGLAPELAAYGFDRYHFYTHRRLERRMNWKMVIDTFLEPYHFAVLHPDTVAPIFFPNLCLFEPFGAHLREVLPRRTIVEMRELPEPQWDLVQHTAVIYVLFPSTVVVMQGDHAEIWRVFPDGDRPDSCVIHLDFYVPEPVESDSARRHWDRNLDLVLRTVEDEDFPIGERMQFGYGAGAQTHVTYGRNEPALQHWQRSVASTLAAREDSRE